MRRPGRQQQSAGGGGARVQRARPDLDRRRVTIQRSGITRERPAMHAGWQAEFQLLVPLPEYIPPITLHEVLNEAGRLCGIGNFRPTFGRFVITSFDIGFQD